MGSRYSTRTKKKPSRRVCMSPSRLFGFRWTWRMFSNNWPHFDIMSRWKPPSKMCAIRMSPKSPSHQLFGKDNIEKRFLTDIPLETEQWNRSFSIFWQSNHIENASSSGLGLKLRLGTFVFRVSSRLHLKSHSNSALSFFLSMIRRYFCTASERLPGSWKLEGLDGRLRYSIRYCSSYVDGMGR